MRHLAILVLFSTVSLAQDRAVPPEVKFKSGYVNPAPRPAEFTSAMLWGIAIADTREAGYENAVVEVGQTRLTCRANGRHVVLNDDRGDVRGGLYSRRPWFGTDAHDPIPIEYAPDGTSVILRVGTRPEKVWHFWAASPRAKLPGPNLQGCTVKVRARISAHAILQVGFDYWRNPAAVYGKGGNNHEAGASRWYFSSGGWLEAEFSDIFSDIKDGELLRRRGVPGE